MCLTAPGIVYDKPGPGEITNIACNDRKIVHAGRRRDQKVGSRSWPAIRFEPT